MGAWGVSETKLVTINYAGVSRTLALADKQIKELEEAIEEEKEKEDDTTK